MSPKTLVTAALLAFVALSVLVLVRGRPEGAPGNAEEPVRAVSSGPAKRVTAYYFHGTARCRTCLAIENTAREVLERELAEDFSRGAIRWRAIDYEQPEHEHFAKEFELTGATLVLAKEAAGRTERWDKLERVWELIGDEARFGDYVLGEARGYLEGT